MQSPKPNRPPPDIDYGTAFCELCRDDTPVEEFGRHLVRQHSDEELGKWPGGIRAALEALRQAYKQGIEASGGHSTKREQFKASLRALEKTLSEDYDS